MKVKYLKEIGRVKAGEIHIVNSPAQVDHMVNTGMAEMIEDGITPPPFDGISPYRTEEEIKKEMSERTAYAVETAKPEDAPVESNVKKGKKA